MISESLGKLMIETLMSVGYSNMSTEDKNILVTYISQIKKVAYTDIDKEYILNMQKEIKIKELSDRCEEEILKGFKSPNGYTYRTNRDDQINMIGMKDYLDSNPSVHTVHWKTEDVGYIAHSREDWINQVYFYGINYRSKLLMRYDSLKRMVVDAEIGELVNSIDWDETVTEEYGEILNNVEPQEQEESQEPQEPQEQEESQEPQEQEQ